VQGPKCGYSGCAEPLSWWQRSDAVYCSMTCRVAAHRERHSQSARPVLPDLLGSEPVQYPMRRMAQHTSFDVIRWLGENSSFVLTSWSMPMECATCRTQTDELLMPKIKALQSRQLLLIFCDWKCLGKWADVTLKPR
jgi:hypothetical protein